MAAGLVFVCIYIVIDRIESIYFCPVLWPARETRQYMFGFNRETFLFFLVRVGVCYFGLGNRDAHLLLFPLLLILWCWVIVHSSIIVNSSL